MVGSRPLEKPHEGTTLLAVAVMFSTGLRVSEAVGIRCSDLDIPERSVRVTGKGSRERTVFFPGEWMSHLLNSYLATRSVLGIEHPLLFFNRLGAPLSSAAMRTRLDKAANRAGIVRRITPHMLRHSAATQLIESGVDIRYVQRLLGHSSLSTTEIYTHVSDSALRGMVATANVLERTFTHDN
jgi:integrase/recombinase XerD